MILEITISVAAVEGKKCRHQNVCRLGYRLPCSGALSKPLQNIIVRGGHRGEHFPKFL